MRKSNRQIRRFPVSLQRSFFTLTVVLLIVSFSASAQWRPNPYYFNYKGVKADSVLILPRDTIHANVGAEPDSGRLAYKAGSLWFRDATSWKRVTVGVMPSFVRNKFYYSGVDFLEGQTQFSDPSLDGLEFELIRVGPSTASYYVPGLWWEKLPGGGIKLLREGDQFYGEGDIFLVQFYPKGVLLIDK